MTLAELLSILAAAGTLYGLWNQRRYHAAQAAVTFSQADSNNVKDALTLKAEYKADLKDLRAELEEEHAARKAAEVAMNTLQNQIANDIALRESAIKTLTARIIDLQSELETERAARQNLEKRLSELDQERQEYALGVGLLMTELIKRNITPPWKPRTMGGEGGEG